MADVKEIELENGVSDNIADDGVKDSAQEETEFGKFLDVLFDQDTQQIIGGLGILAAQLYQAVIGSLLLVFVPQSCTVGGTELCSFADRLSNVSGFYVFGVTLNFITLVTMCIMYAIESQREKYLIDHMDTSLDYANDDDEVSKRIAFLSPYVQGNIRSLSLWYQRVGYLAAIFYVVNVVISGICISDYVISSQTWSTFTTNCLAVLFKIMDVYYTISTTENIFLSAYLKTKVQFNDIDFSHKTEETERELKEEDMEDKVNRMKAQQKAAQKLKKK